MFLYLDDTPESFFQTGWCIKNKADKKNASRKDVIIVSNYKLNRTLFIIWCGVWEWNNAM